MLENPRHPIWKTFRIAVVGTLLIVFLHLNYKHGLVPEKDFGTVLSVLLGLIGFDVAKDRITNKLSKRYDDHSAEAE